VLPRRGSTNKYERFPSKGHSVVVARGAIIFLRREAPEHSVCVIPLNTPLHVKPGLILVKPWVELPAVRQMMSGAAAREDCC
jgi:hypothetical protein